VTALSPHDDDLGQLDGRLAGLRRRIDEQGLRARTLRRRHRELAAAGDERREAVLDHITGTREQLAHPG
jgi:hypothetical protein